MKEFLRKKNIIFSAKRYGIDALGAMAQGLFASLLIGTIISTLGEQLGIGILVTVGGYAKRSNRSCDGNLDWSSTSVSATCIVSLAAVGMAANELGGAGGPLAVLVVTIFAAEIWKTGFKRNKNRYYCDTICDDLCGGSAFTGMCTGDRSSGKYRRNCDHVATELQPFFMGIIVSVIVGIALTLPISSAAICAALSLTGLAGGAAVAGCCAQMVGFAVMSLRKINGVVFLHRE